MQLANFLAHCSSVLNLSASSVRGYRSAICTTIKQLGGPAFEADFLLREVARGASLKEARNPRRVPLWDLFLVLDFIRKQPFEPLGTIPFDLLTLKTTFLLLLATGRRRSEIHGLSGMPQDLAFHRDGSITLHFLPEFLAKNQDPEVPSPSLRVRPLSDILTQDDEDRHLCPVRCLKYYWDRSRHRRSCQRRLLISLNENYKKDIAAGTISRWVSQIIRTAYSHAHKDISCLNPRTHEVRAIATSAAFQHSVPLQYVLEAAFWRSENPFNFYLRDFRMTRADGSKGISFVAANTAVSVTRAPIRTSRRCPPPFALNSASV
ncbi:uncharacterized protein LOC143287522 [Babylonia areolata]|uniref:uncharacterized protein LOC143287522 n=1 Tax=Babylonia areolata TaxID=304850 RepID=UPI003FCF08D1